MIELHVAPQGRRGLGKRLVRDDLARGPRERGGDDGEVADVRAEVIDGVSGLDVCLEPIDRLGLSRAEEVARPRPGDVHEHPRRRPRGDAARSSSHRAGQAPDNAACAMVAGNEFLNRPSFWNPVIFQPATVERHPIKIP